MKNLAITAVIAAVLLASAAGAEPVELRYKYSPGDKYIYSMTADGRGNVTTSVAGAAVAGEDAVQDIPVNMGVRMMLTTKVAGVSDDGLATLETQIGQYRISQSDEIVVDYDVEKGRKEGCTADVIEMLAQPLKMKVDPQGGVSEVTGLQKLNDLSPQFDLSQLISQMQQPWPEKAVKTGDTWTQELPFLSTAKDGENKTAMPLNHFEMLGYEEVKGLNCAKIKSRFSGDITELMKGLLSGLPAPSAQIDLMFMKMDSVLFFAPKEGILVGMKFKIDQDMRMSMIVPAQGSDNHVSMKMNMVMEGVYQLE